MADLIAREDYALSIGGGGCSSYAANRGVTKARAISMGASVSGSYSDNQLVAQKDLYKAASCTCNTQCVGYECACNQECKGYALACNSECGGYWCTCNGDTCPTYCGSQAACSCNSQCNCYSQSMCTAHCFSEKTCSCDGVCEPHLCTDKICNITYGQCSTICQCTSRGTICYQDNCTSYCDLVDCYNACPPYCWCYGGHCHYYGETSSGCLPNCSDCGSNCNNCICNNDTCSSHCDGYGGAGCTCWNNNRYTCTCWNEARYSCTCWSQAVYG